MSTSKREYQAAIKDLKELLGNEADAPLKVVDHFVGELRQATSRLEATIETLTKELAAARREAREATNTVAQLRSDAESSTQQFQGAATRQEREKKEAEFFAKECLVTLARIAKGNQFVFWPGERLGESSISICLAVENNPRHNLIGLRLENASREKALNMMIELSQERFGIDRRRYWDIVRSTFIAASLLGGDEANEWMRKAQEIQSEEPIERVIARIREENRELNV